MMSGWLADIGKLRAELKAWVRDHVIPSLVIYTNVAASTSLGDGDALESSDEGTDGAGQGKGQRPVARIQPFGFFGVPPKGIRGLALRLGSSNVLFLGIAPQSKYGPSNAAAGESGLYCSASGTIVKLDKDGNITITAASGKDVTVNGGSAKVGRVNDPVNMGTWVHVPAAGAGVTPCKLQWAPPSGGTPADVTGAVELDGTIKDGAAHFKG